MSVVVGGCGVDAHDDSCLCDVIIGEPVEIRYGFDEVKFAGMAARATSYKEGDGGERLAAYLEALAAAVERSAHLVRAGFDELDSYDPDLHVRIGRFVRKGHSVVDAPIEFGESWARIVSTLTRGQPSKVWLWGELDWIKFECMMEDQWPYPQIKRIARELDAGQDAVRSLCILYGMDPDPVKNKKLERLRIAEAHRGSTYAAVNAAYQDANVGFDDDSSCRRFLARNGMWPW